MVRQVNLAVIGTGYWGTKLIGEYLALGKKRSDLKLCAVVDSVKERLEKVSNKFGLPSDMLYSNYRDVMRNHRINALHIATPMETHCEIALDAIDWGKHILLEKPMALSSREAFKLARHAEKKGRVLLVGHIYRFNNAINKVKEMIEDGTLGEPYYMDLRWTTYMQPPDHRDVIFDLAPHPIDIVNHLLEEWPQKVSMEARSYQRKTMGLEETAFITANLPNEQIATISMSWIQPGPKRREVMLVGSKATVYIDTLLQRIHLYNNGTEGREIQLEINNTIATEINHFVDAIINDNPPTNSSLIGSMTVLVVESMKKSLHIQQAVPIFAG